MATSSDENRDHWLALASQTARRVNLGWWLERLAAPLVVTSTAGACVLLLMRRDHPATPFWWLAAGIGGALAVLAVGCWLVARLKFESREESLVRIEATMRLRNALSAAKAGVAPWPAPQAHFDPGIRWNWPRLLVPMLGALLLLTAGLFIPVSAKVVEKHVTDEPQAWTKIESDLNKLKQDDVVDETYLEDMKKRVDELRSQKEEDWFSHSSLEATDGLKKAHDSELKRVDRELGRAEKALGDLQKSATSGNQADQARQANEFDQALQGLQSGAMKPNPALLNKLKALDPKNLGAVSPEQMQQLKDGLKKASDSMKGAEGQGQGDDWSDQLLGDGKGDDGKDGKGQGQGQGDGEGNGDGQGDQDGSGNGQGAPTRGPGHDDKLFGKEHEKMKTGDVTGLESKDLSRSTPADLLQLQDGEHQVDKTPSKITGGGDTKATGQGGDAVWKESLDPAEQRAMGKYFGK